MTPRSFKKPTSAAPGLKILISASALAATFGGWAVLAHQEQRPVTSVDAVSVAQVVTATLQAPTPQPTYLAFDPAALPTVIPAPTLAWPTPALTAKPQVQVVYEQPANAAPPPNPDPAAGLRVVEVPPPPPPSQPQSGGDPPQSQPSNNNNDQSAPPPPPVTTTQSSG